MSLILRGIILFVSILIWFQNTKHAAAFKYTYYNTRKENIRVESNLVPADREHYATCPHNICSHSHDYPEKAILDAMSDRESLKGMFGIILNSTFEIIKSRFGSGKISGMCSIEETRTIFPRVMMNTDLFWKFIVNVGDFQQSFQSEFCSDEACKNFDATCQQAYQEVFFLTYENGTIDFDKFWIPTTCRCMCDNY